MDSNTPIFKSKDAGNGTGEHLESKNSDVNNLVTSDQTKYWTGDGSRSVSLSKIVAKKR